MRRFHPVELGILSFTSLLLILSLYQFFKETPQSSNLAALTEAGSGRKPAGRKGSDRGSVESTGKNRSTDHDRSPGGAQQDQASPSETRDNDVLHVELGCKETERSKKLAAAAKSRIANEKKHPEKIGLGGWPSNGGTGGSQDAAGKNTQSGAEGAPFQTTPGEMIVVAYGPGNQMTKVKDSESLSEIYTKTSRVRILGKICGVETDKPSIENLSNEYEATVFLIVDSQEFSTDYIPLQPGENRIQLLQEEKNIILKIQAQ